MRHILTIELNKPRKQGVHHPSVEGKFKFILISLTVLVHEFSIDLTEITC